MSASASTTVKRRPSQRVVEKPTWEMAYFFPAQGAWTEDDFFGLEDVVGKIPRVEYVNGRLEVLPMPTQSHQFIIDYVYEMLKAFVRSHALGVVLFCGMKIRVSNSLRPKYRDADVVFMKKEHASRRHEKFWDGADLTMEVVSGDRKDRKRDLVTKVKEYAAAGI